jgi:PPOX class probable F420-dependent enzyme
MTPQLQQAIKKHQQWFGSYKRSGELVKVQVWLTLNQGQIEFITPADSFKVKRVRRNSRVVCTLGSKNGPVVEGTAEIITDPAELWRVYRAYWKTHPLLMLALWWPIRARLTKGRQVLVRVRPSEPNPLAGITDPAP